MSVTNVGALATFVVKGSTAGFHTSLLGDYGIAGV
jgi:hypothetical protein